MSSKEYTALPDGLYSAKEIYENFLHVSRESWEKNSLRNYIFTKWGGHAVITYQTLRNF